MSIDKIKDEAERFHQCFEYLENQNIVIYGIGQLTKRLLNYGTTFHIVGLMDSDSSKIGTIIDGYPVISMETAEETADCIIINTIEIYWASIASKLSKCKMPVYYRNGQKMKVKGEGDYVFSLNDMYPRVINKDDIVILKIIEEKIKDMKKVYTWEDFGFCILGPIVYSYCCWLYSQTRDKYDCLFFLSRDGYLLHKDYDFFCKLLGLDVSEMHYIASGRRITYVASVNDSKSYKEVLQDMYCGSFESFMKSRFDISVSRSDKHASSEIILPRDIDILLQWIEPYKEMVSDEIRSERIEYQSYLKKNIKEKKNIAVIDVGQTGKIIWSLKSLLPDKMLHGYFFFANYSNDNPYRNCMDSCFHEPIKWRDCNIKRYLYLIEGVFTAPEGIAHKVVNGEVLYYESKISFEKNIKINEGIKEFILKVYEIDKGMVEVSPIFVDRLFGYMVQNANISNELMEKLEFEDVWTKTS